LAFQGIIHIAYNVNLIPITGVPLSYISKGGSNQAVSLIATALLIIISANGLKRVLADEVRFEEETVYGKKIQKFFR
jgi:cell division protein FtsW (lipid II flippase)